MKNNSLEKKYSQFSFEDFLQDDYFISSMKKPTSATSLFWEQFRKENLNLDNYEAAKEWIESFNYSHYTLSSEEVATIRQGINKKKNRRIRIRHILYWNIGVAAAACISLLVFFLFPGKEKSDAQSCEIDIASFAAMYRFDSAEKEIQLMLSDERTIHFDQKEAVISHDTTEIIVDKEIISQSDKNGFNQLVVPYGKRSKLNLSDGTVVWVNAGSRLIFPVTFDKDKRELFVDGEIYIEVAEETDRPFLVKTKNVEVQVLGTKFNVSAYHAEKETVVLVSGSVDIISKEDAKTTRLQPNQMYWSENGLGHVKIVDTQAYISWVEGIYYCNKESLETILHRLSVYYGVEIECEPSIATVIFSGKLDLKENLSDIIEGIAFTIPISYSVNNNTYTIFKMR